MRSASELAAISLFSRMASKLCNAKSLKMGSPSWTVTVQVLQRFPPMRKIGTADSGKEIYRKYVLSDIEGTIISAVMFDNTIPLCDHLLHPYKTYNISNARIRPVEERFRISDYNYTWTITNRTPIEAIKDVITHPINNLFQLQPVTNLYNYADKDGFINIMGLIVHRFPEKSNPSGGTIKNYILLTSEKLPIILTMWIDVEKDTIIDVDESMDIPFCILATNLKVSTYGGLSLNSRKYTYLMHNPPMSATDDLLRWFHSSENDHSVWNPNTIHDKPHRYFHFPPENKIVDLETAANNMATLKTAWVRGKLQLIRGARDPSCVMCGYCRKIVDADPGYKMNCISCKETSTTRLGLRMNFNLSNASSNIRVSAVSPVTEDIISLSEEEIQSYILQNLLEKKIEDAIKDIDYTCFLKVYYPKSKQKAYPYYSILKFCTLNTQPHPTAETSTEQCSINLTPLQSTPPEITPFSTVPDQEPGKSQSSRHTAKKHLTFEDASDKKKTKLE